MFTAQKQRKPKAKSFRDVNETLKNPTTVVDGITGNRKSQPRNKEIDDDFYLRLLEQEQGQVNQQRRRGLRSSGLGLARVQFKEALARFNNTLLKDAKSRIGADLADSIINGMLSGILNEKDSGGGSNGNQQPDAEGYVRLRKCMALLDSLSLRPGKRMVRSMHQREFHDAFLGATMPLFFGKEDWKQHSGIAPEVFGVDASQREVIISAPRQVGKTEAVAAFVACALVSIPGIRIAVFSKIREQCMNLLQRILNLLESVPNEFLAGSSGKPFEMIKTGMQIVYDHDQKTRRWAMKSRVQAYSSEQANARGLSADLIVIEEMAFVSKELFEKVIVPLLGVSNTALVGISTPGESDDNFFNMLMECESSECHDGNYVNEGNEGLIPRQGIFKTIQIHANVCITCRQKLRLTSCVHAILQQPSWKPEGRMQKVKKLLKSNAMVLKREALGLITEQKRFAFERQHISRVRTWPLYDLMRRHVPVVVIGVDPTGHGNSNLAICSLFATPRGTEHPTGSSDGKKLLADGGNNSYIVRAQANNDNGHREYFLWLWLWLRPLNRTRDILSCSRAAADIVIFRGLFWPRLTSTIGGGGGDRGKATGFTDGRGCHATGRHLDT